MFNIFLFDDIVKTHNPLKWTFACFLVSWYQARCWDLPLIPGDAFNYNKLKKKESQINQFSSPKQKYKKYS